MKKTVTINLNGIVFHIDEDAYDALQTYLNELGHHFSQDEGPEIMNDIEARIAELFNDKLKGEKNVVDIKDVESVISILGHPNEFDSEEDTEKTKETKEKSSKEKQKRKKYRRFYRDPENEVFGGVCSGLAAYLNWDVTLVRILFIIILILGFGWIIPIYFILWIVTPEARTAAQRLEMKGEEPSIENIKNYVESDKFKESANRIGNRMGEVFRWFFKILFILVGGIIAMISIFVLLIVIVVLMSVLIAGTSPFLPYVGTMGLSSFAVYFILISLSLVIIIPFVGVIIGCIRLITNSKRPRNKTVGWTLFIIWLVAFFALIGMFIWGCNNNKVLGNYVQNEIFEDNNITVTTEMREVDTFNAIDATGNMIITLSQGPENSITIEAVDEYLPLISTSVNDGVLKIKSSKTVIPGSINVKVTSPQYTSIKANGATVIKNDSTITANSLSLKTNVAANIDLDVNVKRLDVNNNNASKVEISGIAQYLDLSCNNASSTDLDDIHINKANMEVNNASLVELGVVDTLSVIANNGSTVTYEEIFVEEGIKLNNGSTYRKQ